ncbi:hypothetical protein ACRAWG_35085 [Methylobacterium sp. P31]
MSLRLQPAHVATGNYDTESLLVFAYDFLVAVLVQLSDDHDNNAGMWFLEAGFGPVDDPCLPTFVSLDTAQTWIEKRLASAT